MKPRERASAIIYCQGAFGTTNGKTAHGLVRRSSRYRVLSVVDAKHAGEDAGEILGGVRLGIPVFGRIEEALQAALSLDQDPSHMVIGLAPDGGRMGAEVRRDVILAIRHGLDIDSGLHDLLTEDPDLEYLAFSHGVSLRDVRKPPPKSMLHFFSGRIEEVESLVVAVLGTDSAVGKRTTAWLLVDALVRAGLKAEMVGTGQTAWFQGARFGLVMDCLPNDFVAGEIEHAVVSAWDKCRPDVIVVEGQGSLMHPAYPGGFEILAAARPRAVVLQHAPARRDYDGFPGHQIHPLAHQIEAIECVSGTPVVAVTVNHEALDAADITSVCDRIASEADRPAFDVLAGGSKGLLSTLSERFPDLDKAAHGVRTAAEGIARSQR